MLLGSTLLIMISFHHLPYSSVTTTILCNRCNSLAQYHSCDPQYGLHVFAWQFASLRVSLIQ
jgi:hypothetical protein